MRLIDADKLCEDLLDRWSIADKRKEELIRGVMADIVTPIVASQPNIEPQPRWIPCSERLPEDDAYVLISKKPSQISGYKFSVTIGVRYTNSRSHKTEWRDSGFGYLSDDKVLAWQPLPSPYREEERP